MKILDISRIKIETEKRFAWLKYALSKLEKTKVKSKVKDS